MRFKYKCFFCFLMIAMFCVVASGGCGGGGGDGSSSTDDYIDEPESPTPDNPEPNVPTPDNPNPENPEPNIPNEPSNPDFPPVPDNPEPDTKSDFEKASGVWKPVSGLMTSRGFITSGDKEILMVNTENLIPYDGTDHGSKAVNIIFEKAGSYYNITWTNNYEEATPTFFWDGGSLGYVYEGSNTDKGYSLVGNKLTKENYIIPDDPTGNLHSTTFELVNDSKIILTEKVSKTEEDYLLEEITFKR